MPLFDIGPRGYYQADAAATATFTPQYDRAAIVKRVLVDKPSAGDIWRVKVQGKEVSAFDIQTTGNQQPLAGPYSGYPKTNDFFLLVAQLLGMEIGYPVPQGQSLVIASDGGATANISLSYQECRPEEISPAMINHPAGSRFVLPLVGYRAGTTAAVGEVTLGTQVGPSWFPNIFTDGQLPPGWRIKVLAMFLEGGGRNTYNGSADVQSVTDSLVVFRNGQRLYTRATTGGIPLVGQASATGSANTVVGTDTTPRPPFQEADFFDIAPETPALVFDPGTSMALRLNLTGLATGGATYASMRQLFLCDVMAGGAS